MRVLFVDDEVNVLAGLRRMLFDQETWEIDVASSAAWAVALLEERPADVVVSDGEGLSRAGGADVILATGNSWKAAQDAMKGLRPDGRLVLMGLSDEPLAVTAGAIMNRHRIIGSLQNDVEYLYEALDFVARGKVKVVTEVFPLKDIARAYERVSRGEVRFRAVIVP